MACPYFIPAEPHERELWPHRYRLSLGDGFAGCCGARAPDTRCADETLRLHCNLGYANLGSANLGHANPGHADTNIGRAACAHLPAKRDFDAVRFTVQGQSSLILRLQFACERDHQPAFCGELRYDRSGKVWLDQPDPRLLPLAEAAVRAWVQRHESDLLH